MNLFIHHGALGDWVLTFPLLRALPGPTFAAAAWSKAKLAARFVPGVTPLDGEGRGFTLLHAGGAERMPVEVDGLIVSFVSHGRDAWAENARRLATRAQLVFLDPRPPQDWTGHVCEWHRHQLREQGVSLPEVDVAIRHNPAGPIVIHPGSGGREKCWPRERFEELIEILRARGETVTPLLGEVELATWPAAEVERWVSRHAARVVHSLDDLADALLPAKRFIGNDSGPTHLAAQIGLPTLALFGPTSPRLWQPIGPAVRVIAPTEPKAMEWLSVERFVRGC